MTGAFHIRYYQWGGAEAPSSTPLDPPMQVATKFAYRISSNSTRTSNSIRPRIVSARLPVLNEIASVWRAVCVKSYVSINLLIFGPAPGAGPVGTMREAFRISNTVSGMLK